MDCAIAHSQEFIFSGVYMDFSHWFLLFCTLLGFYNLGNIWFVQLVVYPLFVKVGAEDYSTYHRFYLRQIPLPVILPGFANFLLPIALIFCRPESVPLEISLANAACGLLSLVVTVALEIPRHDRLEKGDKLFAAGLTNSTRVISRKPIP
jgi:hypothetical protein